MRMLSPSLTLLRTQSDRRLVELARAGHERAFEVIVERYRRSLLRSARRVLPEGRAEDALQNALLNAWSALQRGDEVGDLRSWLHRIVHRCALNLLRMSGYDYDELEESLRVTDGTQEELERRAVVRQTLASLAALPDRQREALLRTALSGDAREDVARDLGLSENALRQLVHRARVSVRAAATALTPLPLVTWLAAGGARSAPVTERIAELTAGAASGGAAAGLAKASTVIVVAGGALGTPAVVDRAGERGQPEAAAAAAAPRNVAPSRRTRTSPAATHPRPASTTPLRAREPLRVAMRDAPVRPVRSRRRDQSEDDERGSARRGGEEERELERDNEGESAGPERDERDDDSDEGGGRSEPEPEPTGSGEDDSSEDGPSGKDLDEDDREPAQLDQAVAPPPLEADEADEPDLETDGDDE
jgi:RNA polymerase sigma factor (sigma-70 family)